MKLALRIAGTLYLLYGFIKILQIPHLLIFYKKFEAEVSVLNIAIFLLGIFIFALLLLVASSSSKFTNNARAILLLISILIPAVLFVFALILPILNLRRVSFAG
jgi:hypothetical protein